jgi:hypothetical protein
MITTKALPFFKKIFVSRDNLLGEVDDLVNESLPRRIEETLKGDFFAAEARNFIDSSIDTALSRPLPDVIGQINPDQLQRLKDQIAKAILGVLRGEEMMRQVSAYVTDTLAQFRPHSIDSIMRALHPRIGSQAESDFVEGAFEYRCSRGHVEDHQRDARDADRQSSVGSRSDGCRTTSPKKSSAPRAKVSRIRSSRRSERNCPKRSPNLMSAELFAKRSTTIRSRKLEALVLSVAKDHLRKIELFGAMLGLFLGIAQAGWFYYFRK